MHHIIKHIKTISTLILNQTLSASLLSLLREVPELASGMALFSYTTLRANKSDMFMCIILPKLTGPKIHKQALPTAVWQIEKPESALPFTKCKSGFMHS